MMEFVVREDSWHYRVNMITVTEGRKWDFDYWLANKATFCSYFWRTTWSIFVTVLLVSILLTVVGGLIWLTFAHFDVLLKTFLAFGLGVLTLALVVITCMVLACIPGWIKDWLNKDRSGKEPGFIGMKYHAFKNKYCPSIKFER